MPETRNYPAHKRRMFYRLRRRSDKSGFPHGCGNHWNHRSLCCCQTYQQRSFFYPGYWRAGYESHLCERRSNQQNRNQWSLFLRLRFFYQHICAIAGLQCGGLCQSSLFFASTMWSGYTLHSLHELQSKTGTSGRSVRSGYSCRIILFRC